MVALGLMAILMTMIAQIFYQATQTFRMARAGVEIHQNARAGLNSMLMDLAAAEMCTYGKGCTGYFALRRRVVTDTAEPAAGPGNDVELTFTTLAPQLGAKYAAPEAVQQLALVRYTLQWEGAQVTMDDKSTRPLYRLVKRVRFPRTNQPDLDMETFNWDDLPLERGSDDVDKAYAAPEPVAFGVLSMNVRVFLRPPSGQATVPVYVDAGKAEGGSAVPGNDGSLTDDQKAWTGAHNAAARRVRLISGAGEPGTAFDIKTDSGTTLTIAPDQWTTPPGPNTQYWIETALPGPAWYDLGDRPILGIRDASAAELSASEPDPGRPPALVEITLEMTDRRNTRFHTFTERFYIPASER